MRLGLIEPKQAHEFFPAGRRLVPCGAEPGGGVSVEGLLASTCDPVEVANALHALGQLGSGLRAFIDLLGILECLLGGHGPHPCLTYLGDLIHHVAAQAQLRLLDAPGRHVVPGWKRQHVQQAECQGTAQLQFVARDHALKAEDRVGDPASLGRVGRLRPTLRQQSLQGGAVHQGQLNGLFLSHGLSEQGLSGLRALVAVVLTACERELAFGERAGFVVHAADVLIQADAGASGQNGEAKAGQGQSGMSGTQSHHCLPPP